MTAFLTPEHSLAAPWALLQAYDYADDSDLGQIADADIATDPALSWKPQTGSGGLFTKSGKPARFLVTDANGSLPIINGVPVKVIIEPAGEGIITAFPHSVPKVPILLQNGRNSLGISGDRRQERAG